ncbi:hypothetical protein GMA11_04995 [Granulicatella sp. zg-ZJ]|uniref:hypothetical protein n=1 Tax=Granulicatella sp. zg-ZJ TaxID=2678504 RepID=UPI0013CFB9B8|nr:hypothetical protein [Granulicatella sp. zg-ZJ]NEW62744.1 hypothetical protein [Granulicatella sp. zg-ZJ]
MKKILTSLLFVMSIFLCVMFMLHQQIMDHRKMDEQFNGVDANAFHVYHSSVDVEEMIKKLEELSQTYKVSFLRTDIVFENNVDMMYKSGVFREDYFNALDIDMLSGEKVIKNNQIIATYDTNMSNQIGIIRDLFNDDKLQLLTLDNLYQQHKLISSDGEYQFIGKVADKEMIYQELANVFGVSKDSLLKPLYEKGYDEGTLFIIGAFLLVIAFAIFSLVSVFYPISRLREIGMMKLLGVKSIHIWLELNKRVVLFSIVNIFTVSTIAIILIPNSSFKHFIALLCWQFCLLFSCMCLSGVSFILIRKISISRLLKNFLHFKLSIRFSYLLKFFVFIGLIALLPSMVSHIKQLYHDIQIRQMYEQQQQYMTLSNYTFVSSEFQDRLQGNDTLGEKLGQLFVELEKTANAEYIRMGRIKLDNQTGEYVNIGTINEHYMKRLPFSIENEENIFTTQRISVLVPEILKQKEEKVLSLLHLQLKDLPVQIIYYPENKKPIFSENIEMERYNNGFVMNPILICLQDKYVNKESIFLGNSAISNPIRVLDNEKNKQAIQEAIKHHHLELNQIEFANVLTTGFSDRLAISSSSVFVWVIGSFLAIVASSLASYFILLIILMSKKKEILVSRLLGYTLIDRYKLEFMYFGLIYIFAFVELILLSFNVVTLLVYSVLVLLDILMILSLIKKGEGKALTLALKGEE